MVVKPAKLPLLLLFSSSLCFGDVDWKAVNHEGNCWENAGLAYQVNPWLLYAIAEKESSLNPMAVNDRNKDGTSDYGLMQINDFWIPLIEKYGYKKNDLFDPCTNIHIGAWVLAQSIKVFGNNWRAVGAYNAGTRLNEKREFLRQKYASSVFERYERLVGKLHKPAE